MNRTTFLCLTHLEYVFDHTRSSDLEVDWRGDERPARDLLSVSCCAIHQSHLPVVMLVFDASQHIECRTEVGQELLWVVDCWLIHRSGS